MSPKFRVEGRGKVIFPSKSACYVYLCIWYCAIMLVMVML